MRGKGDKKKNGDHYFLIKKYVFVSPLEKYWG